jgi:hypothetical protein
MGSPMFMKITKWVSSTKLPLTELWLWSSRRPLLLLGFAVCAGGSCLAVRASHAARYFWSSDRRDGFSGAEL